LEQAKCTDAKVISEDGEEAIKQLGRKAELGGDEDDGLEYDEEPI
jgi:hypothetical protein